MLKYFDKKISEKALEASSKMIDANNKNFIVPTLSVIGLVITAIVTVADKNAEKFNKNMHIIGESHDQMLENVKELYDQVGDLQDEIKELKKKLGEN